MIIMISQPAGHVSCWQKMTMVVHVDSVTIQHWNQIPVSVMGTFSDQEWRNFGLRSPQQKVGVLRFRVVRKSSANFEKVFATQRRLQKYS